MLTEIFGVGPILTARIVGMISDVSRFPSKAHYFASYTGMAVDEKLGDNVKQSTLILTEMSVDLSKGCANAATRPPTSTTHPSRRTRGPEPSE